MLKWCYVTSSDAEFAVISMPSRSNPAAFYSLPSLALTLRANAIALLKTAPCGFFITMEQFVVIFAAGGNTTRENHRG